MGETCKNGENHKRGIKKEKHERLSRRNWEREVKVRGERIKKQRENSRQNKRGKTEEKNEKYRGERGKEKDRGKRGEIGKREIKEKWEGMSIE